MSDSKISIAEVISGVHETEERKIAELEHRVREKIRMEQAKASDQAEISVLRQRLEELQKNEGGKNSAGDRPDPQRLALLIEKKIEEVLRLSTHDGLGESVLHLVTAYTMLVN